VSYYSYNSQDCNDIEILLCTTSTNMWPHLCHFSPFPFTIIYLCTLLLLSYCHVICLKALKAVQALLDSSKYHLLEWSYNTSSKTNISHRQEVTWCKGGSHNRACSIMNLIIIVLLYDWKMASGGSMTPPSRNQNSVLKKRLFSVPYYHLQGLLSTLF